MDDRVNRVASLANIASYDAEATAKYIDGAPHIKHSSLRRLYGELVVLVFDRAKERSAREQLILDSPTKAD